MRHIDFGLNGTATPSDVHAAVSEARAALMALTDAGDDDTVLTQRGRTFTSLGWNLMRLGQFADAREAFGAGFETLWKVPDRQGEAVHARVREIFVLASLERYDEALALVEQLIGWEIDVPMLPAELPLAHWLRVETLRQVGRDHEAYDCARELVERYWPGSDHIVRQIVASALLAESELGKSHTNQVDFLRPAHALVKEYGRDAKLEIREMVAEAALTLALAFEEHGRPDSARSAYAGIIRTYGESQSPRLRTTVADAGRRLEALAAADG